jgi:hypothetical protein
MSAKRQKQGHAGRRRVKIPASVGDLTRSSGWMRSHIPAPIGKTLFSFASARNSSFMLARRSGDPGINHVTEAFLLELFEQTPKATEDGVR